MEAGQSPQRNNRLEEINKTAKNEAKGVHGFFTTKWTVRGETLDSIINNYDQLMPLWEWSLQKLTNSAMKTGTHGAMSYGKKNRLFFSCKLRGTILNQTDSLNRALEKPTLSVTEALDLALKSLAVLRK